uniref:NADH-ubiquinone oxidoreductase chain 2 n=1 Tax=Aphrophora maritima TaxID=868254 RepID=A0A343X9M6_9HEMI|nr:NADH dehydrogenase subunit 2 [Aphrophora maritima]
MLLLLILIFSTLMSMSSNNWFGSWMGLEINLVAFIPLIHTSLNYFSSESSMKYFVIQSMSSSILLLSVIIYSLKLFNSMPILILMCSLLMKLGVAPFHMWLPGIMEGMNWFNCIILSTWQKVAVLMLLSYLMNNFLVMLPVMMSLLVGSIGGINQSSMKKLMAYSSINNMAWVMMGMSVSTFVWMNYFFYYSFMISTLMMMMHKIGFNYLNQFFLNSYSSLNKYFILLMMFSLGGLPPLLGFMPKWMVIQSMVFSSNYLIGLIMVMTSLLTLFYYMRILVKMILINSVEMKWMKLMFFDSKLYFFICFTNMFGFMMIMFIKTFY